MCTLIRVLYLFSSDKTFQSSDGTIIERATTNAPCCVTHSISPKENGSQWRWPEVLGEERHFLCTGGDELRNFQEWIDDYVRKVTTLNGQLQGICINEWRYVIKGNLFQLTIIIPYGNIAIIFNIQIHILLIFF